MYNCYLSIGVITCLGQVNSILGSAQMAFRSLQSYKKVYVDVYAHELIMKRIEYPRIP